MSSSKTGPQPGEHGFWLSEGLSTAFSWLSVFPVRGAQAFDATTGRRAMTALPGVGIVFGLAGAALGLAAGAATTSPLFAAAATVCCWQLLSRMMHLDALADVGDALGSYQDAAGCQRILADSTTGALGLGAVLLNFLVQTAALSVLWAHVNPGLAVIALAPLVSRTATLENSLSYRQPLKPTGFAPLVIGVLPAWRLYSWYVFALAVCLILAATTAFPAFYSATAAAVVLTAAAAKAWVKHLSTRFAGLNGDCMGATIALGETCLLALGALATIWL